MRCQHCGNRISLLRKLKDSEFCSDEHRELFVRQQQSLAVTRLIDAKEKTPMPPPKLMAEARAVSDSKRPMPRSDSKRPPAKKKEARLEAKPNLFGPHEFIVRPQGEKRRPIRRNEVDPEEPQLICAFPHREPALAPGRFTVARQVPISAACVELEQARLASASEQEELLTALQLAVPSLGRTVDPVRPDADQPVPEIATAAIPAQPDAIAASQSPQQDAQSAAPPVAIAATAPVSEPVPASELPPVFELAAALEPPVAPESLAAPELQPVLVPATEPQAVPEHPLAEVALAGVASWSPEWTGGWQARVPSDPAPVAVAEAAGPVEASQPIVPWPAASVSAPPPESTLPSIDLEAIQLEEICARHVGKLLRLRMPRVRPPKAARNATPVIGHPLSPLRPSPAVVQRSQSGIGQALVTAPVGVHAPWPAHWFSPGSGRLLTPPAEPVEAQAARRRLSLKGRASAQLCALGQMVSLPLHGVVGRAVLEQPEVGGWPVRPKPGKPELLSATICRMVPAQAERVPVPLLLKIRRPLEDWRCKPPSRPVVSYHWTTVQPEITAVPVCDWVPARTEPVQLRYEIAPRPPAEGLAPHKLKPFPPKLGTATATLTQTSPRKASATAGLSGCATRMLTLNGEMEKCVPHEAARAPRGVLETLTPAPVKPLPRPSGNKATADWQKTKWSSVYGSAIWRIAIGKFSGALDQAPTFVRWAALGVAMALAAVAVFPGGRPQAPDDKGWILSKRGSDPAPAANKEAANKEEAAPPPVVVERPVRRQPVAAKPASPARRSPADEPAAPASGLSGMWENFQNRLAERAAVAHTDDFRNGLAEWEGAGEWARSWSYDASGFVRTGALALYAPTRGLTDYRMEFLGQIERRSMGWAIRAHNPRNYYALKLTIVGAGPEPEVVLVRYPVINGVAGAAKQTELPIPVQTDTVYRVLTEVSGDSYSVAVQGKIVDSWNESRLDKGGVGLFSGKGELARVRWVGVWHQYDTLGRLCALLVPSGLPGRERGAN